MVFYKKSQASLERLVIKAPKNCPTSNTSGQTNVRRVLRVDRQILRVDRRVLFIDRQMDRKVLRVEIRVLRVDKRALRKDKWALRVGEEHYD